MPVQIHGKEYKTVAERLDEFHKKYPTYKIDTSIDLLDGACLAKAVITTSKDSKLVQATGHAYEIQNSSMINKTSYIECAETSAVGRALAFLGFAGVEIASADEVANAIKQQSQAPAPVNKEEVSKAGSLEAPVSLVCSACDNGISVAEKDYSIRHHQKTLCRTCQGIVKKNPAQ